MRCGAVQLRFLLRARNVPGQDCRRDVEVHCWTHDAQPLPHPGRRLGRGLPEMGEHLPGPARVEIEPQRSQKRMLLHGEERQRLADSAAGVLLEVLDDRGITQKVYV